MAEYTAAEHIPVPHESLHPGDLCPACPSGRLYELAEPEHFLRIVGQAALVARSWDCQRLRCSSCGKVHTARAPQEAQGPKYTETAASVMALHRYAVGLPLHRTARLQGHLGVPLPASTQWEVLQERVELLRPVYLALLELAAQGTILHNDASYMRVLAFMGQRRAKSLASGQLPDPERTGLFTTAIVSIVESHTIALFFTGRKHAGENLAEVLDQRAAELGAPILMCDGLDRNRPVGHLVIECNCLAHGRRKFADEVPNYPAECHYILEAIGRVYAVDDDCRAEGLSPAERLRRHQAQSGPVMQELHTWMKAQLDQKRIEPNSGMGKAINYMLKRWDKLTLFLRVAGVPLDNNVCERVLKMAILHRRNSLFYKTPHGALVGDIYMTLIHTAVLHGQNPFLYLTALQVHAQAVAENPADWLPWNYSDTLARMPGGTPSGGAPPPVTVPPSGSASPNSGSNPGPRSPPR